MFRNLLIGLLTLSLLGIFTGCGKDSASSSDNDMKSIADRFGGFTPTDEPVAFGDPTIAAESIGDEPFDDNIAASPAVDSIVDDALTGAYALRIIWGSMHYDSTITVPTDWTGSLAVNRGAEVLRRTIRFEPAQDYILPRTDRKLIEWVSQTTVHNDGIFVNLYIPPADTADTAAVADSSVTVTFDTAPFEITFHLNDLKSLDTIYYLADSVNAVAIRVFKIEPLACSKGFFDGHWGTDSTGQGIFGGRWISIHGATTGYIEGIWGNDLDTTGDNLFFGKYIDINGQFEGLLRGKYKPHPNMHANPNAFCHAGGWIFGNFFDGDGNAMGVIKGHYLMPKQDSTDAMGYMQGRWKTFCPRDFNSHDGDGHDGDGMDDRP